MSLPGFSKEEVSSNRPNSPQLASFLTVLSMKRNMKIQFLLVFLILICPVFGVGEKENQLTDLPRTKINSFIQKIRDDQEISKDQQSRLLSGYEEVLNEFKLIEELSAKIAEIDRILKTSPEQIQQLKKSLSEFKKGDLELGEYRQMPLPELEQNLTRFESELAGTRKRIEFLDSSIKKEMTARVNLPKFLSEIRQQLADIEQGGGSENFSSEDEQVLLENRQQALIQRLNLQIESYEKEIISFDQRIEILKLRKELKERESKAQEQKVQDLRELVSLKRREEAELANLKAQKAREEAANSHPLIQELTAEIADLAIRRSGSEGLTARLGKLERELREVRTLQERLENAYQSLVQKVKVAGMTDAVGLLFRKQKDEIPHMSQYRSRLNLMQREISRIQVQIIQLEEHLESQGEQDVTLELINTKLEKSLDRQQREDILQRAKELLSTRQQYLEDLLKDLNSSFLLMVDLDAAINQLLSQASDFSNYINENILWIRSNQPLQYVELSELTSAFQLIANPNSWIEAMRILQGTLNQRPVVAIFFLLLLVLQILLRRTMIRRMQALGQRVRKSYVSSFRNTVEAFAYTLLLSLFWPSMCFGIALFCIEGALNFEFLHALGMTLLVLAKVTFVLQFLRYLLIQEGLGENHFLWIPKAILKIRRHLLWLTPMIVSSFFVFTFLEELSGSQHKESLGRLFMIVCLIGLSVFSYRAFHPSIPWMEELWKKNPKGYLKKFTWLWFPLLITLPLGLAILSAMGYHYAALQMLERLQMSFLMLIGLLVFSSSLFRLMFNLRRSLAMERTEKRAKGEEKSEEAQLKDLEAAAHQVEIPVIHLQTQRFLRGFSSILFLVGLFTIWLDVFPALSILNRVELWYDTMPVAQQVTAMDGSTTVRMTEQTIAITLGDILLSLIFLILTWTAVNNLPGLLEISVLRKLNLEPAQSYAVVTVFRYSVVFVGFGFAFSAIGIGWGKVQWLAAAFTVGLGFGLQEIFANFVAGLIILFEQPIRLGDTVTVGDTSGTVSKIRIRATTITEFNRKELIIPNKEFITGQLVNWSLSDKILRLDLPVGLAYGSELEKIQSVLFAVSQEHPKILKDPKPHIIFTNFGDNAIEFEFRVFINEIERFPMIRSEVMELIYIETRKAGLEIPFPQRDLHVKEIVSREGSGLLDRIVGATGRSSS